MHHPSINPLYSSLPVFTEPVSHSFSKDIGDRYLWGLLHLSDHHESDVEQIASEGLGILNSAGNLVTDEPLSVGSPDWVFLCGNWNHETDAAIVSRDSKPVAAIQKEGQQLKLVTFDFLSARLVEALFELGHEARVEESIGEVFWKRAETVSWRHGLGTLGYLLSPYRVKDREGTLGEENRFWIKSLSQSALPNAYAARQLRVLYKYG